MASKIVFAMVLAMSFVYGCRATVFTVKNNCPFTIWPATLTLEGAQPNTGFELASKASTTINVSAPWSGRIWARFQCETIKGRFSCRSGDCGSGQIPCNGTTGTPPATLVEFTLAVTDKRNDFFDVSIVDGFNLPVSVKPDNGFPPTACSADLNRVCPKELAVRDPSGEIIGCKSPCLAFQKPKYCCNGPHSKCKPSKYSQFFKEQCDQAYSYPGVTFCPWYV